MKKYSMLGAAIRHPIKMFFLSILMMFVILIVSIILNINLGDDEISIIMIAGVISAAYILKRRCNKGSVDTPKPRRRKSLCLSLRRIGGRSAIPGAAETGGRGGPRQMERA